MARPNYCNPKEFVYYSKRYNQFKTVPEGYCSDGASGPATDIYSQSWWVHDILYEHGAWDDGTPCTYQQANNVLRDILLDEGRYIRANVWWIGTTVFGGAYRWLKK